MELKDKLDEMGKAFHEFKQARDKEILEIKTYGVASAATSEKVDAINTKMTALEVQIEGLKAALNRTGGMGPEADQKSLEAKSSKEYKAAMLDYMRTGNVNAKAAQEFLANSEYKDMSVMIDSDGGFLVTPETSSEVVKKVFESSPIRQLASVQNISSDSLEILEDLDEAASGWVGETGARSSTGTPSLKEIKIYLHELYAKPKATQKLLDDAGINVESWLAGKVSEKFARDEATAFVSGNGVKKPQGIFSYASGTSFGQVERVLTAANNALVAEDLIDTQTALKEAYQNNASWLINRVFIGTIRKMKDAITGQYIWQPGLLVGKPNVLLGQPVYMASDLPSTITATTDTMIYGDIKAGYQIVDRIGIRTLRDPFSSKPFVEFYTTKRVGGAVKNFEAIKVLRFKT